MCCPAACYIYFTINTLLAVASFSHVSLFFSSAKNVGISFKSSCLLSHICTTKQIARSIIKKIHELLNHFAHNLPLKSYQSSEFCWEISIFYALLRLKFPIIKNSVSPLFSFDSHSTSRAKFVKDFEAMSSVVFVELKQDKHIVYNHYKYLNVALNSFFLSSIKKCLELFAYQWLIK